MASQDQLPNIYQRAVGKYQEITKEALDVAFISKLRTVDDLTHEIDERNRSFSDFRHRRSLIFDSLQAALVPVQLFGSLAAGGAAMAFPPSSLVFGAVTYLMNAAKGVSSSYDAIQELMGSLKDFTIRLKIYSQEQISTELGEKLSDVLSTLIEIFALSTKAIRRGRLLKFTRNVLLGSSDAIQAAVGKLDKLTRVEADLVGAETLTEAKKTGRTVSGLAMTVNATNSNVQETGIAVTQMSVQVTDMQEMLGNLLVSVSDKEPQTDRDKNQQEKVRQMLKPSNIDSAQAWYDKISKARIPGTGDWVLSEKVFNSWIQRDDPIIFLSGNPGAGKSYLSTNIISFLRDQHPQNVQHVSHISVAYFFFKDDNPDTRSVHQALRDLAYQISINDPAYLKYLTTIEDYGKISTLETAWSLLFVEFFLKKANVHSSVYIVFDGVDEALDEERRIFLALAKDLYESPGSRRLQLALVGRPHVSNQLYESLEVEVPTIHVTSQKNSADIDRYIEASIKRSVVLKKVSATLRQEIFETLSARAEGMFLWVNLMMQELVKRRSQASMRKSLEQAPKGLKEMMRHVLSSFSANSEEEELEYLNELLLWTACSAQPLSLVQVEGILRLKSPEGDGMIYLEGALRKQFASFFTVDRVDGLTTAELHSLAMNPTSLEESDDERDEREEASENEEYEETFEDVDNFVSFDSDAQTTTVTFCHASIGDFFRDENEGKVTAVNGSTPVGVNWRGAKIYVLKTCLRLFTESEFAKKCGDANQILMHAARNWLEHLKSTPPSYAEQADRIEIARMLVKMFSVEEVMNTWLGRRCWSSTKGSVETIRQWWDDVEVLEALAADEQEFIMSTKDAPFTTFKPVALFCWGKMMTDATWIPSSPAAVVWSYQKLLKDQEVDVNATSFNPTVDELLEAAEFLEAEKTAFWYRRVGMILRELGHYGVSLEYFGKAHEASPDDCDIMAGMSMTYLLQKNWQKVIEMGIESEVLLLKQLENEPDRADSIKWNLHGCLERQWKCYLGLNDFNSCLSAAKRALEYSPDCDNCINQVIYHQHRIHQHEENIAFLKSMGEVPAPGKEYTLLIGSILENAFNGWPYFECIADSALVTNSVSFMIDSWRAAAKHAQKASRTVVTAQLDMSLARIYCEFAHDETKAIRRWEKILNSFATAKEEGEVGYLKVEASYKLATHFLSQAIDAGIGSPEAEEQAGKLEKLVHRVKPNDKSSLWSISRAQSIALGLYHRLSGRHDKSEALFKPSVKRAVEILSDDDPENDREGLIGLYRALIAAGDISNVLAIAYALGNYRDGDDDDDDGNNEEWEPVFDDSICSCDRPCRVSRSSLDRFSLCPICFDTGFCEACVKLLQEGKLGIKRCSAKHVKDFIYIPRRPQKLGKDQMLVDGTVVGFSDWLGALKKKWKV
ncbi:uncharacterized protein N7459_008537 [Penicillium hispanicum]|uniref:uncharacterized protein n=1 Tax=Penicillium hispanicum TaxID=1080232 RepID=UPI002541D1FC|nr:uncharacterized protein N7459_008537 [Penicillium hispanicum]KAJ5574110.1 hypothetical protein N7459_008537 [Penicillium hispanicum]